MDDGHIFLIGAGEICCGILSSIPTYDLHGW
jgi:hypothetical protein